MPRRVFAILSDAADNGFALLAGEPRTIAFKPQDPKKTFRDSRRSLTVKSIRYTY